MACSILIMLFLCTVISATNITRDHSALLKFKSNIIDPQRRLEDWAPNKPVCKWTGVTCGISHQRIISLDISNMTLSGKIPPELGNLSFLVSLNVGDNDFTGNLPEELVHLRRLRSLNLTSNHFTGPVPFWLGSMSRLESLLLSFNNFTGSLTPSHFNNLTNLEVLRLRNNSIRGEIPQEIGNLKNLLFLDIQYNNLSGSIPSTIYNLSLLEKIGLSSNGLSGNIPTDLCHYLPRLDGIHLSDNQFVGRLPTSLHKCSHIQVLSVAFNKLTGSIPNNFGNLTFLRSVEFHKNNISGMLPQDIGNLEQLENLILSYNSMSGVIPISIGNCSKLQRFAINTNQFTSSTNELSFITSMTHCKDLEYLDFSSNPISGFLPNSIGNLSDSLQFLEMGDCKINGVIPFEIGNLSSLIDLSLGFNTLSGFIPSSIKGLVNLQMLEISDTGIGGAIPISLCDLPYVSIVYLGNNKLTGNVPSCLGTMSSLSYLYLYNNKLESSIPLSLWNLKDLLELLLNDNRLSGTLPDEVGKLGALTWLDLSTNRFSGKIPSAFGNLQNLQTLTLKANSFEGTIPDTIGKMYSLEALDISNNNLSGVIPNSLTKLKYLEYFNVSFNKLFGEIPTEGPFKNFNASFFALNPALCGSSRYHVPPCIVNSSRRHMRRKVFYWSFILAGITFAIVVIALTILLVKYKRRKSIVSAKMDLSTTARVSYYDLLRATEQFSQNNLLGTGSFGSVYKALLSDGEIVAVKVFKLEVQGAFQSFDAECEVLRNLRHRNLTKVITSCSNGDDFKALVLEYMANGSLEKWLHSENHFLDMLQRLRIMVDVSQALEYLHYGFSTTIVHCDIKPSNVLLDENMIAHLCDFGLTRFLKEEASVTYTNTLATVGYIAPEYGSKGQVSPAGDIYSFGILMMETFTKKRPCDELFTENVSLKEWVHDHFSRDQSVQVLDFDLLSRNGQRTNQEMKSLSSIMELALNCCKDSPKERMNIKDVRVTLEKIKLAHV
ncbi:hypothetical protein LIER_28364 [Lithospermum erythrorhizon]|uniref:non-specific serine/threonine protein kinase n=1 Tax=Lithospermum erythrorhizon TaxID=34254 RepID=A0AAV3RLG2_LITER